MLVRKTASQRVLCVPKVEEAVAVLQAHQAKKEAAQKVGVVAATS